MYIQAQQFPLKKLIPENQKLAKLGFVNYFYAKIASWFELRVQVLDFSILIIESYTIF